MGRETLAHDNIRYIAASPTPDTGIAASIQTSFAATAPFMTIFNNQTEIDPTNSTFNSEVVPTSLRLLTTVAPASAVSVNGAWILDNTNRYSSGGSALTPSSPIGTRSRASGAVVNVGAITASAVSAPRVLSHFRGRSTIPVVGDEFLFNFTDEFVSNDVLGGTIAQRMTIPTPMISIPKGFTLLLYLWFPSNAAVAGSFEVELNFKEMQ